MRVSGPASRALIDALTGKAAPTPRMAAVRALAYGGKRIDRALLLFFAAPASFTGEDMVEFQIHGGRAVAAHLGRALAALGATAAAPGEFTRRAFENGKLDLTQAEAIADLTAAETEAQAAQALDQANGALLTLYEGWRARLVAVLALMEASLDFPDEDLPATLLTPVEREAESLAAEISLHLADVRRGARLRDGITIAVLGAPNAGKSSLVNALSERAAAIVSPIPGTTRDVIEVPLDLGGYPVILIDTAGLRDSADPVETEGIARARARAAEADLKLLVFDASTVPDAETQALIDGNAIVVQNKCDLLNVVIPDEGGHAAGPGSMAKPGDPFALRTGGYMDPDLLQDDRIKISISTLTGNGIPALLKNIIGRLHTLAGATARPAPTRERHRAHLAGAKAALLAYPLAPTPDLAAEELRRAATALGRLTGRIDSEELLDRIFRDFCIGK